MGLKYIGDGRSPAGIPARDLSDEEARAIESAQPGFLAGVEAGDTSGGGTPAYRKMTSAELGEFNRAQDEAARERKWSTERKFTLRREDRDIGPYVPGNQEVQPDADTTNEEN